MKVINTGNNYVIYSDNVKTYDKLPAQCYQVSFSKDSGFFLVKHGDVDVPEKAYGIHEQKVNKVLKSFDRIENKNLGVVLSGDKGIGKSFFAKMLAKKAIEKGIPVIIVDRYFIGIANYIQEIEQEVLVMFDEFDKTFGAVKPSDNTAEPQTEMLTLFDGTAVGKKLFVITCNNIFTVSQFLVNRPGRFHYHFRFDYPSAEEIKEYMHDKIGNTEWADWQIDEIIRFSKKVPLNYDCLRAISFELNGGEEFKDAIKDLNIVNMNSNKYDIILHYTNGVQLSVKDKSLDMFNSSEEAMWLYTTSNEDIVRCSFNTGNAAFDGRSCEYKIEKKNIGLTYDNDYYDSKKIEELKGLTVDYLSIIPHAAKSIHYVI